MVMFLEIRSKHNKVLVWIISSYIQGNPKSDEKERENMEFQKLNLESMNKKSTHINQSSKGNILRYMIRSYALNIQDKKGRKRKLFTKSNMQEDKMNEVLSETH